MADFENAQENITLPWWMDGAELSILKTSAKIFWSEIQGVAKWPFLQIDPATCSTPILSLLAWQRDIPHFPDESLEQFRLRVIHAYANAYDSGSVAGFQRIFERLQLGYVELEERHPDKDWDIIVLRVSDSVVAQQPEYMSWIIQKYGRTCRRYEWDIITPDTLHINYAEFGADYQTFKASI